jgi:hypothetical protein
VHFADLLAEVIAFAELAITDDLTDRTWDPDTREWV